MSRIYHEPPSGKRILVLIECDLCDASIRPGPHVVDSGWMNKGWRKEGEREWTEITVCPAHAREWR